MVGWYLNDVIEALCEEGGEQLKNREEIVHFVATPQFMEGSLENQSQGKREKELRLFKVWATKRVIYYLQNGKKCLVNLLNI